MNSILPPSVHSPPQPPSRRNPVVDPRLEAICLKAMAKKPAERYASMAAFAGTLLEYANTAGTAADQPRTHPPPPTRLWLGEGDDDNCERTPKLRGVSTAAGLESPPVAEIREAIWSKLLTNMSLSVLCLLTGQTARGVRDDPAFAEVIPRMLNEANDIAQHFIPEVKRVTRSGPAPNHKPSLLQDYEIGRAMEIDVLVKAPAAFARTSGLPTPTLDLIAALAIQKARDKGLYSA